MYKDCTKTEGSSLDRLLWEVLESQHSWEQSLPGINLEVSVRSVVHSSTPTTYPKQILGSPSQRNIRSKPNRRLNLLVVSSRPQGIEDLNPHWCSRSIVDAIQSLLQIKTTLQTRNQSTGDLASSQRCTELADKSLA